VCYANAGMLFLSLILTIWVRPYSKSIFYASRIGGDICMLSVWIVFAIKIIPIWNLIAKAVVIEESVAT